MIDNTDNSSPFGDALTFAFMVHRKNTTSTKQFFMKHFNYEFTILKLDEQEQDNEMNIIST